MLLIFYYPGFSKEADIAAYNPWKQRVPYLHRMFVAGAKDVQTRDTSKTRLTLYGPPQVISTSVSVS